MNRIVVSKADVSRGLGGSEWKVPDGDPSGLTASLADAAEREGIPVARLDPPPDLHPLLAQFPLTVRLQSLASRWADRQGIDPDTVILGAWADPSLWSLGARIR